ncbi:MAG TPA: RHS repeat-associated core domain-containing protein, partial [Longimicrobium sp.]|nr:RHS repeat-associated core domain-containing protein [Longimicrobium sp.]
MPGLHRVHSGRYGDGVMITEGDGRAWFFEAGPCHDGVCTYKSPEGDFSVLERSAATGAHVRRYRDGTRIDYWAWGCINTVHDRFGNRTLYDWGFNTIWYPTGVIDPAGKITLFYRLDTSTCQGCRIAGLRDPGGRVTWINYDAAGNVASVLAPDSSYVFQQAAYSGLGVLTGWKDARGGQWNLGYTSSLVSYVDEPAIPVNGTPVRPRWGLRAPQGGSLRFNAGTSVAAPAPGIMRDSASATTIDPEGHVTHTIVDRFGNPTEILSPTGEHVYNTYDARGLPQIVTVGARTSQYVWNQHGDLIESSVMGSDGWVPGFKATYTHFGQPYSVTRGGRTTWYRYDAAGVLVRSWTGRSTDADSLQKATTYTFDGRGRPVAVTTPDVLRTETKYFADGWLNLEWTRQLKRVGSGDEWVATYFAYDGHGRNSRIHGPDSVTVTEFDALNRVARFTNPHGGVTTYGYTGPDLTSVTDPSGKVYRWAYDAQGRVTTETDPEGRSRTFAYNKDDLVTSRTDRRGMTVAMTYFGDHRLRQVTADGATTTYSYSLSPNGVTATSPVSTDTLGDHQFHLGVRSRAVHVLGGRRYVLRYMVDDETSFRDGLEVTASAGGVQNWQHTALYTRDFDPADPALAYWSHTGTFSGNDVSLGFDEAGRLTRTAYPNGVSRFHDYDAHRRPTVTDFSSSGLTNVLGATYQYDYMNRLVRREAVTQDSALTYRYDKLGRLTSMEALRYSLSPVPPCDPSADTCAQPDTITTVVRSHSFAYDAVGNRTDRPVLMAPGSNRYTSFDGWTLEYDAEGNLTRKWKAGMDQRFTWNALGQLSSVTTNGRTVHYRYNGFGVRVKREDPATGDVVWYLYDGGNLLMELDAYGTPFRSYAHAGVDQPLSVTIGNPSTGATYFYVTEQPGHVRGLLNASGGLANKYVYRPFGQRETGTVEAVQQPLQFMSRERDELTGIYYVRARWYDVDLARFVSEDPIGIEGGINTYAYADNDPIGLRDPSGLYPGSDVECANYNDEVPASTILWCWQAFSEELDDRAVRWDRHMQAPTRLVSVRAPRPPNMLNYVDMKAYLSRCFHASDCMGRQMTINKSLSTNGYYDAVDRYHRQLERCMAAVQHSPYAFGGSVTTEAAGAAVGSGADWLVFAVWSKRTTPAGLLAGAATGIYIDYANDRNYRRALCTW